MKSLRSVAILAIVLLSSALRAQEVVPTLPVRKDPVRPGWFMVGVVPGAGKEVPILVELRSGSEDAAPFRYRAPGSRSFDLCAMLRAAGLAGRSGVLFLSVSRGPSSFRFRIPYDGKLCAGAPPPQVAAAEEAPAPSGLAPLVLELPPPPGAPASPSASPATPSRAAEAAPSRTEAPAAGKAAAEPLPAQSPAAAQPSEPQPQTAVAAAEPGSPAPAAAPASEPEPEPEEEPAAPGPSAEERGLTKENFDGLSVFLLENKKLKTEDVRFVLRFRKPVNVDGVDSLVIVSSTIVMGRTLAFLPNGEGIFIDPPEDPSSTLTVSATASLGLARTLGAGVNQLVTATIQVGVDPPLGVFRARAGLKRGKAQ